MSENEGCRCPRCQSEKPGFDEEIEAVKKLVDEEPSRNDLFGGIDPMTVTDPMAWAEAFDRLLKRQPAIDIDPGLMVGWFANFKAACDHAKEQERAMRQKLPMTTDQARERVRQIEARAGDDEGAHSEEDRLRGDVLRAIAGGNPNAAELARIALLTDDIEFSRWCA